MSVPVGALASKSRPITAVNWSSDSSTEKSSSPRKLAGNTSRPCLLITKGFTDHLLGELPGRPPALAARHGTVPGRAPYLLPYPDSAEYARPPGKSGQRETRPGARGLVRSEPNEPRVSPRINEVNVQFHFVQRRELAACGGPVRSVTQDAPLPFEQEVEREGGAMERPGVSAQYWPLVLAG